MSKRHCRRINPYNVAMLHVQSHTDLEYLLSEINKIIGMYEFIDINSVNTEQSRIVPVN